MKSLSYYGKRIRVKELVFCPAKAVYNHICFSEKPINFLMQNGINFEDFLMKTKYQKSDGWLSNALIVYEDLIEGHPDFFNPVKRKLVEAKSRESLKVQPYDIAQAGLYANILQLKDFKIVVGWKENNEWRIKEYVFESKNEILPKMVEHAQRLQAQIKNKAVSEEQWKYCPRYSWECKHCEYLEICRR